MVRVVWPGWWLGLLLCVGSPLAAQMNAPPKVELDENYPNPAFPATTISFEISSEVCERGHQPAVSLKIYNVLVQVIAIPVLVGEPGESLEEAGEPLDGRRLRCGKHRAYWDGRYLDGGREATPGVYYYQLTVDGQRYTRKMIVQRRVATER